VHIPYEGEVPNTDMTVAYNDITALTSALPDKNAPIILYCRSGRMSDIATRALVEQGYTQVWDVTGGMNAWTASGRELVFNQ
jgi:rhodanese-related sulfurtransferase